MKGNPALKRMLNRGGSLDCFNRLGGAFFGLLNFYVEADKISESYRLRKIIQPTAQLMRAYLDLPAQGAPP